MVKWYSKLYMDSSIEKRQRKVKRLIEKEKLSIGAYCICFASNDNNLFDIINTNELLFRYYKRKDIYVVGIATTRRSAINMVALILEEIYHNTGDFKVKEYFKFN